MSSIVIYNMTDKELLQFLDVYKNNAEAHAEAKRRGLKKMNTEYFRKEAERLVDEVREQKARNKEHEARIKELEAAIKSRDISAAEQATKYDALVVKYSNLVDKYDGVIDELLKLKRKG